MSIFLILLVWVLFVLSCNSFRKVNFLKKDPIASTSLLLRCFCSFPGDLVFTFQHFIRYAFLLIHQQTHCFVRKTLYIKEVLFRLTAFLIPSVALDVLTIPLERFPQSERRHLWECSFLLDTFVRQDFALLGECVPFVYFSQTSDSSNKRACSNWKLFWDILSSFIDKTSLFISLSNNTMCSVNTAETDDSSIQVN